MPYSHGKKKHNHGKNSGYPYGSGPFTEFTAQWTAWKEPSPKPMPLYQIMKMKAQQGDLHAQHVVKAYDNAPNPSAILSCPSCGTPVTLTFVAKTGATLRCTCGLVKLEHGDLFTSPFFEHADMAGSGLKSGVEILTALQARMRHALEIAMIDAQHAMFAIAGDAAKFDKNPIPALKACFNKPVPESAYEGITNPGPPPFSYSTYVTTKQLKQFADDLFGSSKPKKQLPPQEPLPKKIPKAALKGFDSLSPALQEFFSDFTTN